MFRTKWVTQLIVAITFLILLSGCAPGIDSAKSGHERALAETRFKQHALSAIVDGDFPSAANINNCLSEPVVVEIGMVEEKDAWVLFEIPAGKWRGVDTAGSIDYWMNIQTSGNDIESVFQGGGEWKIVQLREGDMPFDIDMDGDWSCE